MKILFELEFLKIYQKSIKKKKSIKIFSWEHFKICFYYFSFSIEQSMDTTITDLKSNNVVHQKPRHWLSFHGIKNHLLKIDNSKSSYLSNFKSFKIDMKIIAWDCLCLCQFYIKFFNRKKQTKPIWLWGCRINFKDTNSV